MKRGRRVKPIVVGASDDPDLLLLGMRKLKKVLGEADLRGSVPTADPHPEAVCMSFAELIDPGRLPELQRAAVGITERIAEDTLSPHEMILRPGYLTHTKVVEAFPDDGPQRVYVSHGTFAEITWSWADAGWQSPAQDVFPQILAEIRSLYLEQLSG